MRPDLTRAVIAVKPTKVEFDRRRLGLSERRLAAYYRAPNAALIFASHLRQLAMRERLLRLLPEARVGLAPLSARALAGAELVIALGGDNHFTRVASLLEDTPILGVNADRSRSHGRLLSVDDRGLEAAVASLRSGRLRLELWTRLEAEVDGRRAGRAASEILIGELRRRDMSRHALRLGRGPEEEQKSSGMLVATGAGSTGWFGSYGPAFSPALRRARWALTEPFPRGRRYRLASGLLGPGATLRVRSLNDALGVLSLDCLSDVPFPYGATASIRLSRVPLRVLRPWR